MSTTIKHAFAYFVRHYDSILALLIAAIASGLGFAGQATPEQLSPYVLAVLVLMSVSLIRSADSRAVLIEKTKLLLNHAEHPLTDTVFSHETEERDLIAQAVSELWLVQETGSRIAEVNRPELLSFLRRGGTARLVLTMPTEPVAELMAFRNANLSPRAILDRAQAFTYHLGSLLQEAGADAERLTVRYLPYPVDWTLAVSDPNSPLAQNRRAVARTAGFRVPYADKVDMHLRESVAPQTFAYFHSQAASLYRHATKCVLLTGAPRSGKTTMLKRLVDSVSNEDPVFYVLSEARWDHNQRTGFQVCRTGAPDPVEFAKRRNDGGYELVSDVWRGIAEELNAAAARGQLIILDEVGPLQLRQTEFADAVSQLVEDPTVSLVATLADPQSGGKEVLPYVTELQRRPRTSLIRLTEQNAEEIFLELRTEYESALKMISTVSSAIRSK